MQKKKKKKTEFDDILTIEEAADYLKMNVVTIRQMLKDKQIPAKMVRNKWRFSRRQLQEWVEGKGKKK